MRFLTVPLRGQFLIMARLAVLLRTIPTSSVGVPDVFSLKQTVLQRAHPQVASMAGAYSVLRTGPVSFSFAFAFLRSTNVLTSKISPRERERPILTLFHSHLRAKLYETATLMRPSTCVSLPRSHLRCSFPQARKILCRNLTTSFSRTQV